MGIDRDSSMNTNAMFPNLDQLSESSKSIYVSDHEFQIKVSEMMDELNRLLDTESGDSTITIGKSKVSDAINRQLGDIEYLESKVVSGESSWISQMKEQIVSVQGAYERLYAKILADIKAININIENRTSVFNSVESYKDRLDYKLYEMIGKTSPLQDGRSDADDIENNKYLVPANSMILLRDTDNSDFITFPIVIQPNITDDDGNNVMQKKYVKLFEFTPIQNGTDIPSFVFELVLSGELFAFKGMVASGPKGPNGERGVNFDADYFTNKDLPYSFKTLYDKDRNKIAVVFKFDETTDNFTSIVKFDCSVNLLLGSELKFSEQGTIAENVE